MWTDILTVPYLILFSLQNFMGRVFLPREQMETVCQVDMVALNAVSDHEVLRVSRSVQFILGSAELLT